MFADAILARHQPDTTGGRYPSMEAYGAGMSVYSHFIARGNEVVFPKNTAMQIGTGTRVSGPSLAPTPAG